ncbi:uncharacterized protein SAPINGB_P002274 [Magnusiomyces paraingens]|uniref:C3H1-type domain-containing protein n=1 Tax=Magnusiomyces paraingens TaxID=2606893 RepID=A0A5E8BEF6_9ASCO|nr:uncharacterized protein SAPINGB_P002274 [Saprochaete ingens]VVT49447.1 unnamed protein product [Saprochaete ingens]
MSDNNNATNSSSSFNDEDLKQKIAALSGKINSVKSNMAAAKEKKISSTTTTTPYVQPYPAINSYSAPYYSSNYRSTIPTRGYNNRVHKHASRYSTGRPHTFQNKTYYPPQPPQKPLELKEPSQTPSPSLSNTVSPLPVPSPTPSPTPPVNVVGSQNVVLLNGSQYISKNGTLIRVKNPVQQKQLADAISSTASTKSLNQSTNNSPSAYIKTKSGSLVRVGGTTNKTVNNIPNKGHAKVNDKDILLNPRVMAHCPQFTLTGKCTKGGRCPYARHDRNHLALCKQFLMQNGKCNKGSRCSLSHNPTDHNLPTCTYYLDGRCSCSCGRGHKEDSPPLNTNKRPTECKFAHPPKLAPGTPENKARKLCREFAYTGYCTLGSQKCPYVHSYQCPDFSETGSCNVRNCKLMHVNEGDTREYKKEEPSKPEQKEPEKINSLALAQSLFEDSDDEENITTVHSRNAEKDDSDNSDDNDNESDDEETREFLEFWKNSSAKTNANDNEFKDSDYIKL